MRVMERIEEQEQSDRRRDQPVPRRVVFVTGGMGGIGSAICRRLAAAGHTIIAGCLPDYGRKEAWLGAMRGEGFRVHAAEGDVSDYDSCADMFYQVRSVVGQIDILVNNAGITRDSVFKRMTEDRKSTRLNSSHSRASRMPSSA